MPDKKDPTAEAAGAMLRDQVAATPNPAAVQAQTASVIGAAERGPELPAESAMDEFMARMAKEFAGMKAELAALKAQQSAALAAQGGPLPARYATAVADKVAAIIAQHPDCPDGHFKPLLEAAAKLQAAGSEADGNGNATAIEKAGTAITKFTTRTHAKAWGKSIDFSALLDDVEAALEHATAAAA